MLYCSKESLKNMSASMLIVTFKYVDQIAFPAAAGVKVFHPFI